MVKAICGKPSSDGQTSKNECLGVYRREFHALSLAWPTPVNHDQCTPSRACWWSKQELHPHGRYGGVGWPILKEAKKVERREAAPTVLCLGALSLI